MSIVCATSFSGRSRMAVAAAAALARREEEPLLLAHVAGREEEVPDAERALDEVIGPLRGEPGLLVEGKVLVGRVAEVVAGFASERGTSLLVVAGSTIAPTLPGVADDILQEASVPCLVVREGGPFEAWAGGERPLRVVLGVDGSTSFAAARAFLARLARSGPLSVTAAHVYWPPAEYDRLGLPRPLMFTEVDPALEEVLASEVAQEVGVLPPGAGPEVRLRIGMGWTGDQLVALAAEARADLLLVGTHRRRGVGKLWSVSHHAVRHAPMSVACVPAEAAPGPEEAEVPELRDVVAATDFSPPAEQAVLHAFGLVRPGGRVHLVHVARARPDEEERRSLEERLRALVPRKAGEQAVRATVEVRWGDAAEEIARVGERVGADAICVGSHGRGALARVVLGSVSHALLARTHRPVLVVPRRPE